MNEIYTKEESIILDKKYKSVIVVEKITNFF